MAALLYAFQGNEIAIEYDPNKMFAFPHTKAFWYTPEIPETDRLSCSSQKPTASPFFGFLKNNKETGGLVEQPVNMASFSTPLFSCQILV
jgi:hypothetical protein